MTNHRTSPKFSAEVRERAVRMVLRAPRRARLAVGGDRVDCGQDRLHGADAQ